MFNSSPGRKPTTQPRPKFHRGMLPILGVHYYDFASRSEAERFARWAVEYSRDWDHPCRATITRNELGTGYEVRVANW